MDRPPTHKCRTFPESGDCLLGPKGPDEWNCAVCRAVQDWSEENHEVVLVREILNQTGLYVVPSSADPPDSNGYLMQARLAGTSTSDLRVLLQTILASAEQTWIAEPKRSVRVK